MHLLEVKKYGNSFFIQQLKLETQQSDLHIVFKRHQAFISAASLKSVTFTGRLALCSVQIGFGIQNIRSVTVWNNGG